MEEIVLYKALYNYSPSDDELTEGYIAIKTDDVLEVKKSAQFEAECEGNIQVTRPCLPEHDSHVLLETISLEIKTGDLIAARN